MPDLDRPLGAGFMPFERRIDTILYAIEKADALGYTAFFLPETWSYDVMVLLTAAAERTRNIKLGASILGIWGRSAATMAMAATTLNLLSGGRFILGIGASTPQLAEGWHDTYYQTPVRRLREYVTQVRSLLNGERIPLFNVGAARSLRLGLEPQPELPIYMAATSSRSMRLVGELADGWFPFYIARDRFEENIALVKQGSVGTESNNSVQICPFVSVIVNEDETAAIRGASWVIAVYLTIMGSFYRNTLERQGYVAEVQAVVEANRDRKASIVPEEAEILLEQLTIHGTPDDVQAQVDRWYDAGADMPILMMNPNLSHEEIDLVLETGRPE